jgi:hypothetical protein
VPPSKCKALSSNPSIAKNQKTNKIFYDADVTRILSQPASEGHTQNAGKAWTEVPTSTEPAQRKGKKILQDCGV